MHTQDEDDGAPSQLKTRLGFRTRIKQHGSLLAYQQNAHPINDQ
jgi:hypothetical protein